MKLTRSIEYAIVALGFIIRNARKGPVLARTIANEHGIPREYLFKILKSLVRVDILSSTRGPHGGYYLSKPVEHISLLDIIEAVEGPTSDPVTFTCPNTATPLYERIAHHINVATKAQSEHLAQVALSSLIDLAVDTHQTDN
ncbi:MAG: Rrf2 family transcriptional regulator [Sedimentisphaerales bacterium]|nr:Rrf2 family transcriptional regulator [Sedimentisphaerales bacterium]